MSEWVSLHLLPQLGQSVNELNALPHFKHIKMGVCEFIFCLSSPACSSLEEESM